MKEETNIKNCIAILVIKEEYSHCGLDIVDLSNGEKIQYINLSSLRCNGMDEVKEYKDIPTGKFVAGRIDLSDYYTVQALEDNTPFVGKVMRMRRREFTKEYDEVESAYSRDFWTETICLKIDSVKEFTTKKYNYTAEIVIHREISCEMKYFPENDRFNRNMQKIGIEGLRGDILYNMTDVRRLLFIKRKIEEHFGCKFVNVLRYY